MSLWGKLASLGAIAGGGVLTATGVGGPVGLGLIGAGLGGAKHEFEDLPKQDSQRKLAAETQRYAPWTGLKADAPESTSGIGTALSGGVSGAMLGQSLSKNNLLPGGDGALGTGISSSWPSLGVDTNLSAGLSTPAQLGAGLPMSPSGVPIMDPSQANFGGLGTGQQPDWAKLIKTPNFYS